MEAAVVGMAVSGDGLRCLGLWRRAVCAAMPLRRNGGWWREVRADVGPTTRRPPAWAPATVNLTRVVPAALSATVRPACMRAMGCDTAQQRRLRCPPRMHAGDGRDDRQAQAVVMGVLAAAG
jgi:hypothetical protein